MAIRPIRQRQQAFTQRIGVVNVDTGAEQVGATIASVAGNIQGQLEPFLRQEALKRGTNAAKEVSRQNLVTFDENGVPKALNVPSNFGLVASGAYEEVIERRFENSMREEIQNKSIEYANKYSDPNAYAQAMGTYLDKMDSASTGRFNTFITENGQEVLLETQTKLQIAAEKRRLAAAKEAAKYNTYTALRQLEISRATAFTPESVIELSGYATQALDAAKAEFALTGDRVEYLKVLDEVGVHQAGSTVNLLINSAALLPESERELIAAAIENPMLVNQIQDPMIQRGVIAVHQQSKGMKLSELSEAFSGGTNAIQVVETARDNEWIANNQDMINAYEGATFASTQGAIVKGKQLVEKGPDAAKDQLLGVVVNEVSNDLKMRLTNYLRLNEITDTNSIETLSKQITAALASGDAKSAAVKALPLSLQPHVEAVLSGLDPKQVKQISENVSGYTNPMTSVARLTNEAALEELASQERDNQAAALQTYMELEGQIDEALASENYDLAATLFSQMSRKDLPVAQQNEYDKRSKSFAQQLARLGKTKELKILTQNQANAIVKDLDRLATTESLAEAQVLGEAIKNTVNNLGDNHTAATKSGWLTKVNARIEKLGNESETQRNLMHENNATLVVKSFRSRMESGDVLMPADLTRAKADVAKHLKSKTDFNETDLTDAEANLDSLYATAIMKQASGELHGLTDGKGISPDRMSFIINAAEAQDSDAIKELEGAEAVIGNYLLRASVPFAAKSEVRTRIGKLSDYNTKLFNAHSESLDKADLKDQFTRLGSFASEAALEHYEDTVLTKLAGLEEGATIDYGAENLLRENGTMTDFGVELRKQMSRGVIPKGLVTYLDRAAQLGVIGTNAFEIFNMGSNAGKGGDNLNVFRMDMQVQVDPKTLARFGAATMLFEAGGAASREQALREIVSTANELGIRGIVGQLETLVATKDDKNKKLSDWIIETYPTADAKTRNQLEQAAIAVGLSANSADDLKKRLDHWAERLFGKDDRVIGNRLEVGASKVITAGARSKYLTQGQMSDMDNAAFNLVYNNMNKRDQNRLFTRRAAFAGNTYTTPQFRPEGSLPGSRMFADFDIKYKESTAMNGIYYIYATTEGGGVQQLFGQDGLPLVLDSAEFKPQETVLPELGFYHSNWRQAVSNDPNGFKYASTNWTDGITYAVSKSLAEMPDDIPAASQATLDAEQALIFARFPEQLQDEANLKIFDRLVESGVILADDRDSFLRLGGVLVD